MRTLFTTIAAASALTFLTPLSANARHLTLPTVTVTLNATNTFGMAPDVAGLHPSNPSISYEASDATDQSVNVAGTLTCQTAADAESGPGTYDISSCDGLTVPGYNVIYNTGGSSYTVFDRSLVIGLINRHLPPGSTVELNPQPFPPGAVLDFLWKPGTCDGSTGSPKAVAVPLTNGQQATSEGSIIAPCRANANGSPATSATTASTVRTASSGTTYGVRDYCFWTDANGVVHHYLSFLPVGCQVHKQVAIFSSSIDSGANLFLQGGSFTRATLVTENPMPVLGGFYDAASGVATLDVDDDNWCGSTGRIPIPHPPHCDGSTINVSGVTPAAYDGQHTIVDATANTISFQLGSDPGAGPSAGTFKFGQMSIPMPAGSNMVNLVMQPQRSGGF